LPLGRPLGPVVVPKGAPMFHTAEMLAAMAAERLGPVKKRKLPPANCKPRPRNTIKRADGVSRDFIPWC